MRKLLERLGKPLYWVIVGGVFLVGGVSEFLPKINQLKIRGPKVKWVKAQPFALLRAKKMQLILIVVVVMVGWGWWWVLKGLPRASELVSREVDLSTKIYDRNGKLLYQIYKDENRSLIQIEDVPMKVKLATLAAEDAEFYSHPGFSIRGITRAIVKYINEDKVTGGSTITQQLVKNALLTSEKTLQRKAKEFVLALAVERRFDKDEILEMYLNEVSYGGTAYGIREAAMVYFEKEVEGLTLGEAALLAGLPQSPTYYSPFGLNPEASHVRQNEVLALMRVNGFITKEQEEEARNEALSFAPNKTEILAPHFVMYVREQLVAKYGEEMVEKGGLVVTTTLDLEVQEMAQAAVTDEVNKLSGLNVGNGAALVINPRTGETLAMVGSKNYFDTAADGNVNVLTRLRQPGSSIKIVNYAYALSQQYTAATMLKDTPITFRVPGQPAYSPQNYDGRYRGNISLRSALAESRNVPAVRTLAAYGVNSMLELGAEMGITTWQDPSRYGLSLTLGGGDVKMIDLARVFAVMANGGQRPRIASIRKIENGKGETIYEKSINVDWPVVVDPGVAYILTNILSDNSARTPAFGARSALVIPGHSEVAVKTGTSNNLRDNVTIGYAKEYLVATWVGNNDNTPMSRIASGITGAAPIWNKIMSSLLAQEEAQDWIVPGGVVEAEVCALTGTLPCSGCPTKKEWFLRGTEPTQRCTKEWFGQNSQQQYQREEMIL